MTCTHDIESCILLILKEPNSTQSLPYKEADYS